MNSQNKSYLVTSWRVGKTHQNSGIKIDIVLDKKTDFYISEFSRRKKLEIVPGLEIYLASPGDLILKKLDFYRKEESEKHLNEMRDIVVNVKLDHTYIEHWVDRLSLRTLWQKV